MKEEKKKLGVATTGIIVTVGLAIAGWLFIQIQKQDERINTASMSISELKADISSIKTNVEWIKGVLDKQNNIKK